MSELPDESWEGVSVDFYTTTNQEHLVVIDDFSTLVIDDFSTFPVIDRFQQPH